MNLTNNTERDVELISVFEPPSRNETPILYNSKYKFKNLSTFSPNSVARTNFNTERKKERSLKRELFNLKNDENIQNLLDKKAFFEENKDFLKKKFKNINNLPIQKSSFAIKEIKSSNIKKENSSKNNNNCIFTENKIFYNPIFLKNQDGTSKIKFRDSIQRKDDGHIKKSSFCLKKFNFFKVLKKSQKYYLKELKTIEKKKKKN